MVESDCDLLSLRLSTGISSSSTSSESARSSRVKGWEDNAAKHHLQQQQQQKQQMTFFYGGRMCVHNVTEMQGRAIISLAKLEMDEMMKNNNRQSQHVHREPSLSLSPPTSPHNAIPQLLNQELSMKRSLQRFLQKRKTRIDSASPYIREVRLSL